MGNLPKTDDLLDKLFVEGQRFNLKWVCRESSTGRGMRLHQLADSEKSNVESFDTPKEALEVFFKLNNGDSKI